MEKKFDYAKEAARIRREQEIKEHGKQVSLRRARTFDSKKSYKRNKKVSIYE